ncbi:MAG: hypothetical protein V1701_02295 [Planctomycetota bacterium]
MKTPLLLYYRSIEQIKEYLTIPVGSRLRWLEEGSRFFGRLTTALPKTRRNPKPKYTK